jgi:hypothetical protein
MKRETQGDLIFSIIEKYYQSNGNLEKKGIHEHLIGNGLDISDEVLTERIKYFKDETSGTNKEKVKVS